jgi:hypothetical protein
MTEADQIVGTDTLEKVLFLFLGWLVGLLSPIIVDAIRRRREIKEVKAALIVELLDLQYRLAMTAYVIEIRIGGYDRQFLEWFKAILERYQGPHKSDKVLQTITSSLTLTDEQLALVAEKHEGGPNKGAGLKKHHAPLVDSKLGQLGTFSPKFQSLMLEIHSRLNILNEEIDQYRFYFNATFSGNLSELNHNLITENVQGSYSAVATQCRMICDIIDRAVLLSKHEEHRVRSR